MVMIVAVRCEYCQEFEDQGWNFCGNCGKRLTDTCVYCSEAIIRGKGYCPECNKDLNAGKCL